MSEQSNIESHNNFHHVLLVLDFIPEDDIVDGNCILERGYEIDGENQRVNNDADYDIRIRKYQSPTGKLTRY